MVDPVDSSALLAQLRAKAAEAGIPRGNQATEATASPRADFGDVLRQSIRSVNEQQQSASELARRFEIGDDVELSRVMIEMQKARISFETLSQVRRKLVNAYQEIMNMPV
ncbi:MAG: flagellar hook-basal body complex protein FliE [Gammaproteobacteria bacterium]|nr:MAG: flagellar hook-basal body complex protein FliE [Gammaproteobacteria bacterium]